MVLETLLATDAQDVQKLTGQLPPLSCFSRGFGSGEVSR